MSRYSINGRCAKGENVPILGLNSSRHSANIGRGTKIDIGAPDSDREKHGRTTGGRVSLEEKVDGLVCLGYPVCAMGDRIKLRDKAVGQFKTNSAFP